MKYVLPAFLAFFIIGATDMAGAEEVTLEHQGLTLNGNLEIADGKALKDGVALIVHGTLAHNKMEIIVALQDQLKERGLNTLAINLSLGLDNRHGMYDCAVTHRHKNSDSVIEMAAWIDWLKNKGSGPIVLVGHSRGGNQVSWFMANKREAAVKSAVLIAPAVWNMESATAAYKKNYKASLMLLLGKTTRMVMANKGDTILDDIDFLYCPKTSVSAATFYDYYYEDPFRNTPTALIRVKKKPVLVIAASEDTINPGLPEGMKGVVGGNISLAVIDGAGHFFRDLYGEDVADLIADFIATN